MCCICECYKGGIVVMDVIWCQLCACFCLCRDVIDVVFSVCIVTVEL